MGITTKIWTEAGEERECYIRMNSIEANNHGVESTALFRAYISEDAYKKGGKFVGAWEVSFVLKDVSGNIWEQSYEAFKAYMDKKVETEVEQEVATEEVPEVEDLTKLGEDIEARNKDLMSERRRTFLGGQ